MAKILKETSKTKNTKCQDAQCAVTTLSLNIP